MSFYPKPDVFLLLSVFILSLIPSFTSLPFVIFYGLRESCSTPTVTRLTKDLSNLSGTQGYCIEIGTEIWQSWFTPLMMQVDIACSKVKSIPALSEGYNIVAISQGNLVARGVIEFCDGAPPVKNFIGLGGPHAGVASCPYCGFEATCSIVDHLLELGVYESSVQNTLAPSNYIRIPADLDAYLKGCKFLPLLNNEIATQRNSTYKTRFSSLDKLVLVMFEEDNVVKPRETSWFGYFEDGSLSKLLAYNETQMYKEDWFGLKTLDEAGKIDFLSVPGHHVEITEYMENRILPYLKDW